MVSKKKLLYTRPANIVVDSEAPIYCFEVNLDPQYNMHKFVYRHICIYTMNFYL